MSNLTVYGEEGLSQSDYQYIRTTQQSVVAQELKFGNVVVDSKCNWPYLTQFDTISKRVVGPTKSVSVFVEGTQFKDDFKSYQEYFKGKSGVYYYPKYLGKLLKQSYMQDGVIFLEGSSTRGVKNSDDKINEVARKVLKRLILGSKVKALLVKVASRVVPLVLSTAALSL